MENKVDVALSGKKVSLFVKIATFGKADYCTTFTISVIQRRGTELKFVTTVATGGHVKVFQLCNFFQKTTPFKKLHIKIDFSKKKDPIH